MISKEIMVSLADEFHPVSIVGKAKNGHWEGIIELSGPSWKVILKLSMTLVRYCTRSVLSSPFGGFEAAEAGGYDVTNQLGSFTESDW